MELEEIPCPLPGEYAHFAHFLLKTKMDTILLQGKYSKLHRYKYIIQKKVATILPFSRDNNNAFLVALVMSCQTDKCTLFWNGPFHLLCY